MSILYLFRESGLTPTKNWLFDSIRGQNRNVTPDGATTAFYTDQVFMYVRIGLDIEIKVNLEQDEIAGGIIDYAHIYQDDRLYRFFVVGCEQIALETIKLKLHLDVLNTFFRTRLGDVLSKRTRTIRKTKKNMRAFNGEARGENVIYFNKIIDPYPEGINPQLETNPTNYAELLPYGIPSNIDKAYYKARKWFMLFVTIDGVVKTLFAGDEFIKVVDGSGNVQMIDPIYLTDRSSDDIIRIVTIPYFPGALFFDTDTNATLPSGWEIFTYKNHKYLQKTIFSAQEASNGFSYKGRPMDVILKEIDTEYLRFDDQASYRSVARNRLDPKLYSSEFYRVTLSCDSFVFDIPLEKLVWHEEGDPGYPIDTVIHDYYVTFDYFVSPAYDGLWMVTPSLGYIAQEDGLYYKSLEAHPLTMISNKKYEIPISSSTYLEYVKYGYNYDVNKVTMQTGYTAIAGFSGAAASTIAMILAAIFGGPLGIAAGAIGAIGGIVGTAISAAKVSESGHLDINKKLDTLKAQHANVSGNSEAAFMWQYNTAGKETGPNFAGIVKRIWQPRQDVIDMLNDIFYLYGYACNDIGTPNLREKELFDFIQCEAEFDLKAVHIEGLTTEYVEEAKQLLAQGVTIFHSYEGTFDTTFTHENFDNYLYIH